MSKDASIRVLIGDSTRMNSQLIGNALQRSRSPRFEIAFPSGFTSAETTQEIIRVAPDVAIVGAGLRDGPFAGYSVLRTLQAKKVPTRTVLLLEDCERDLVVDAFRAGARAVFSRSEPWIRLPRCIDSVYKGQIWATSSELEYVFEELAAARPLYLVDANGRNLLSKREQQVVALVAEGFTNRQISQELKLSEHTVKNYLFRVFEKLGISTRVELVLYALSQNPLGQPAAPEPPVSVVELSRRSPPKANFHQSPALSGSSHLR